MAKKKEFFSSFDKNLSIAEEVATVNKQAPPIVKTTTIAKAVEAKAPAAATPVPAAAVASKPAPKAAAQPKAQTQLIKKKTKEAAAPTPEIVKNTNPARPTTFRIDVDLMETIKAVAYWERKKIQDVLDDALRTYMNEIPKQELTKARKAYSTAN